MKLWELKRIAEHLNRHQTISYCLRVSPNVVKILFDGKDAYYFDMTKGKSLIFRRDDFVSSQRFSAPFDIVLAKRFSKARLLSVQILGDDKILVIKVQTSSAYKQEIALLQLEFTGKNTNVIILDEDETILEALRHIDSSVSYRKVRPGRKLLPLPPHTIKEKSGTIEDVDAFLYGLYEKERGAHLETLKRQKCASVDKKIAKLEQILNGLEDEKRLLEKSQEAADLGTLILANMHAIKPYQKEARLVDFVGREVVVKLPPEAKSVSRMGEHFFTISKKQRQKAKNIHIERENLESKILFLKRLSHAIMEAASEEEVEILVPRQQKSAKVGQKSQNYEIFDVEGFRILVGKNEKGNMELLKLSRANDLWLHLKDIPSAHVIIQTDKQNLPDSVLKKAAQLCVDFSVDHPGNYLVDYTRRKHVRIQERTNVHYTDYKTLKISKH